jgi:hypothetical protein
MTCETISSWENNSRAHYGVPNTQFVKPLARINGQPGEIPDGYKIPRCFLERAELYQSGLAVTNVNTTAVTVPLELQIPAKEVKGGERFTGVFAVSALPVASSTNIITMSVRVTDAAGTVVAGTVNLIINAHPVSGGVRQFIAHLDMYYDAVAGALKIAGQTRADATYVTFIGGSIPFDPAVASRIQFTVQNSSVALSEAPLVTFGTLGRVN